MFFSARTTRFRLKCFLPAAFLLLQSPGKAFCQVAAGYNTSFFTSINPKPAILRDTSLSLHPETGMLPYNAPCDNCYELPDRRTEYTRHFVANGSDGRDFFLQQGYLPLHYRDMNGYWVTRDRRLKPAGPGRFVVNDPGIAIEISPAGGYCRLRNTEEQELVYNTSLELLARLPDGSSHSFGAANWRYYSAGDDGVLVHDCWPGIDMELIVRQTGIKTSFIVRSLPANIDFESLVIRDQPVFPGRLEADGEELRIIETNGSELFRLGTIQAYDQSPESPAQTFFYSTQGNAVDIIIPGSWLRAGERGFPLVIDPLVTGSNTMLQGNIIGSRYGNSCWNQYCSYDMDVQVPPQCTVTEVVFYFIFSSQGECRSRDGAVTIHSGSCISGHWWCDNDAQGVCQMINYSISQEMLNCVPAAQCTSYNLPFQLRLYRCNNGTQTGCTSSCISAASNWIMTVHGRTVEVATSGISPASQNVCPNTLTTLNMAATYGVPPYTYSWSPGGMNGASVTVSPSTTTSYTATVTDQCGTTATRQFNLNVLQGANPGFTISPNPACANETVQLSGQGSGQVSYYDWLLPGSSSAPAVNNTKVLSTQYPAAGTYDITLNYTVGSCSFPLTRQIQVLTPGQSPSVTISSSPSFPVCSGTPVTFTAVPVNAGSSPVFQWTINNVPVGSNAATHTSSSLVQGDQVRVTITSGAACLSSPTTTSAPIIIPAPVTLTPAVSIQANPSTSSCPGTPITFTATATNTGGGPVSYQWTVNAQPAGTNAASYISSTLVQGDEVRVIVTSGAPCLSTPTATSAPIVMPAPMTLSPAVSIQVNPSTPSCAGTPVRFTATATNTGTGPVSYQWTVNSQPAGTNAASFTSSSLSNGDQVRVTITASDPCASSSSVTSQATQTVINPLTPPQVSLAVSPATPVCAGTVLSFTASPVNGGSNPAYAWRVNGVVVPGAQSSTYSTSGLNNGDAISVQLTSSVTCPGSSSSVLSTPILANLISAAAPSVTVNADPTGPVCNGTSVTFTALPQQAGSNPQLQWLVNGVPVPGAIQSAYILSSLNNGDQVTVRVQSSEQCANPSSVTSDAIVMSILQPETGSASISVAPSLPVCAGVALDFTAQYSGLGTTPGFVWTVNGQAAGANAPTYTLAQPSDNDMIQLRVTSDAACPASAEVLSNTVTATVLPVLTPSVSISATPSDLWCPARYTMQFTAVAVAGGSNPTYQWRVNGEMQGGNQPLFSAPGLGRDDRVEVLLRSSYPCVTEPEVLSNSIIVKGVAPIAVTVTNEQTICEGGQVVLRATASGGDGTTLQYTWKPGFLTGEEITVRPANTTVYRVEVSDRCGSSTGTDSVNITVHPRPNATFSWSPKEPVLMLRPEVIFSNTNTIQVSRQWNFGDGSGSSEASPAHVYQEPGTYPVTLYVISNEGCEATGTGTITVRTLHSVYLPNTFTPDGDGLNDHFAPIFTDTTAYLLEVFDRWGQLVYKGTEATLPWNGRHMNTGYVLNDGVYIYRLAYREERSTGEHPLVMMQGKITLLKKE